MDIATKLKSNNLKVTPQRISILEYLENSKEHPTAETIYLAVSKEHPNISFATVYKTLDTFRDVGLLTEFNVGEDAHRYDGNTSVHPHFVCNNCNSIMDIKEPKTFNEFFYDFEQCNKDFDFENHSLFFYGRCKKCS